MGFSGLVLISETVVEKIPEKNKKFLKKIFFQFKKKKISN